MLGKINLRLITAGIITFVVVAIFLALIWYMLALRPVDRHSTKAVSYNLQPGTKVTVLAEELEQRHLIRSQLAFELYVSFKQLRTKLEAGNYEISQSDSTGDIAIILAKGKIAAHHLTIPEGITIKGFKKLAAEHGISENDLTAALNAPYSNDFLTNRPAGSTLEGYLYPDTYQLGKPVKAQTLIRSMLNNFGTQVTSTDIQAQFGAHNLTLHQGVTLASIVEKEVPGSADRAMVAQVYLNRLQRGMPLEADPTVAYASELSGQAFSTALNSPYNTYANKGLPPGPICNPSLDAMQAAAHPAANDYLYFIADKQGKTHFAWTFEEHQQNINRYLK